jgi:hypothetical protein
MKFELYRQICENIPNIELYRNLSNGRHVVPCGRTDMKLIITFRNFAKSSKNDLLFGGKETSEFQLAGFYT